MANTKKVRLDRLGLGKSDKVKSEIIQRVRHRKI